MQKIYGFESLITYDDWLPITPCQEQPADVPSGFYQCFEFRGRHLCEALTVEKSPCGFSMTFVEHLPALCSVTNRITFDPEDSTVSMLQSVVRGVSDSKLTAAGCPAERCIQLSRLDNIVMKTDRPLSKEEADLLCVRSRVYNLVRSLEGQEVMVYTASLNYPARAE